MDNTDLARLTAAIDRVRHDVRVTLGDEAIVIRLTLDGPSEVSIHEPQSPPRSTGLYAFEGEAAEGVVGRLADTVQDCVLESDRFWGLAWPACPLQGHPHPLSTFGRPGWWMCPSTGELIAAIGQLG